MLIFKKLIFSLPLVFAILFFISSLNPFLKDYTILFSFSNQEYHQIISLLVSLYLIGIFLITFLILANNLKIVVPVLIACTVTPLLMVLSPSNYILSGGLLFSFLVSYLLVSRKLATYLSFDVFTLFNSIFKNTLVIILLFVSVCIYLSANLQIKDQGFTIPEPLLDLSMKTMSKSQENVSSANNLPEISIPDEQIELLKKNPEALKQYGLDPKILDQLTKDQKPLNQENLIKEAVKNQASAMLNPYLSLIPILIAVLFFFTINWFVSVLSLIPMLLLTLLFLVLTKTGFIHYETAMREVKKLVV